MRNSRTGTKLALMVLGALVVLGGCDIMILEGWDTDRETDHEQATDPSLLRVTTPSGGESFMPGDTVTIAWDGTTQPYEVDIDLYRSGSQLSRLGRVRTSAGSFQWTIPANFDEMTEVANEYQIVLSGFHPGYPGELLLVAYSGRFAIEPLTGGGLSDVEVSSRTIAIRLTDDGSAIDGDTIDLYLNGIRITDGHVLVASPGTVFSLFLQSGTNTLEIYAINEGSVSPNTALIEISDVILGEAAQQWRLSAGEWGSLTVTAP